jgi:hypothetical protein
MAPLNACTAGTDLEHYDLRHAQMLEVDHMPSNSRSTSASMTTARSEPASRSNLPVDVEPWL